MTTNPVPTHAGPEALDGLLTAVEALERTVNGLASAHADGALAGGGTHGSGSVRSRIEPGPVEVSGNGGADTASREEVQRLNEDRAALAAELDRAEERATRLAESNREVARRLVTVMEAVRTVLDRA